MAIEPLPVIDQFVPQYAVAITQFLYFVVSFLAVYLVGRVLVKPLFERALATRDVDVHARRPLKRLLSGAILFVAVSVAFGFAQYGDFLTSLATIAAAATLAVGFAMQDVIRNFVAGIFIYTDRPFKIGDWIEWDDNAGIVEDISLRVSRVRTFDNELLTVPNSVLTDGVIKNPVAKDKLRVKVPFGIGYDDDIEQASAILVEVAEAHDQILDTPGPSVRLTELGDSAVELQARIWISNPSRTDFVKVRGEYVKAVKDRFDEAGIDIPYPQRVLHGGIVVGGEAVDATDLDADHLH
jgi:small-conductance mechanosensitive channel